MKKIAILGAGTWGLALARMLFLNGNTVCVWSALQSEIDSLNLTNTAEKLNNLKLPTGITYTSSIENACKNANVIVIAVPSLYVRSTTRLISSFLNKSQLIVCVAKGIESKTNLTMTEVIKNELIGFEPIALSGPTHAEEVALDLPTTIVAACEKEQNAIAIQQIFSNENFRVYTNTDVLGVEICGAVKNIIAIACGIASGLGYGDNIKAAIITRGLSEISKLGEKLGCNKQTFSGLAGMGDLIVTATSLHSRNNRAGYYIGQGMPIDEAIKKVGMVVEGINALPATVELAKKHGVELPIVFAVDSVVNHKASPKTIGLSLMVREYKSE